MLWLAASARQRPQSPAWGEGSDFGFVFSSISGFAAHGRNGDGDHCALDLVG